MQRVRGVQQVQGVQVRRVQGARQMLALCLAVIALSGTVRSQQADYVRRIAEAAKARNEQARCVIHESGGIVMTDFDDDLKRNSVFLVTPTGRNVVLNLGSTIATLHWLTIDETLAQRPVDSMACLGEIRNAPPPVANEIGVLTKDGTMLVDGVSITFIDESWAWTPQRGQQFVLIAHRCPGGFASLTYGRYSLIPVNSTGALFLQTEHAADASSIRTVQDLRRALRNN